MSDLQALRERHRECVTTDSEGPHRHCICAHAPDVMPCDTIQALDALDELQRTLDECKADTNDLLRQAEALARYEADR